MSHAIEKLPNEDFLLDPKPGTAAAKARDFGIDMGRLVENLRLSPEERINRLDWMRKMMRKSDIKADSTVGPEI